MDDLEQMSTAHRVNLLEERMFNLEMRLDQILTEASSGLEKQNQKIEDLINKWS